MDGIFISYRRDDSAGYAGRLYDRLVGHFGSNRVFMDVEGIELGVDFVDAIETAVGSCKVLIAMIGDEWLSATDAAGHKRLDDPNDFIRLETGSALKRGIRVVPVLVGGAVMPQAGELPDDLKALTRRQAIEVNHKQWEASTGELIHALEAILDGGSGSAASRSDAGASRGEAVATPQVAERKEPGRDARRWMLPVVGAAMAVGAGLWAFFGAGKDETVAGHDPVTPPVVVAEKAPEPSAPAAAKPAAPSNPQPPVVPAESAQPQPAKPAEPTPPTPAPVAPATESRPPVIQVFRADTVEGRTRLCYRVSNAEMLVLSPRPGELRRLAENCLIVRVNEETTFTLTARSGEQVVRQSLVVAPPASVAEQPAHPPSASPPAGAQVSGSPAASGAPAQSSALPLKGERWSYRATGKWANSPKRRFDVVVQSVASGLVTESLTNIEPATGDETRRGHSDRGDFIVWPSIGPEFSPYLGAFVNLGQGASLPNVSTPELDPQWTQWYSKAEVLGEESVSVPAGSFKAVKVEVWSSRRQTGSSAVAAVEPVREHFLLWYAPGAKRYVRMQRRILSVTNAEIEKDIFELVAHRLP